MFIAFLLAVAAPSTLSIRVVPADPTAPFKGDGTALKFDPSCRDYTLETVASDPNCAARVAKGELAPSLAIAARTIGSLPARTNEAVALLKRVAAETDSPAVHYFLGTVLGNAEGVRPNYSEAVRHLTNAADRGNPAAADLLATLLIAGKGTARDVPRAIRLYENAAANGFPGSALTLGKLYLAGRIVEKDETRGRAWLDAAAAAQVPTASHLAALAANDAKVSNFQLIPAPNPAQVKTVRYGTFDNPDIPSNFGFDPAFQTVHDAPYDDPATLAKLEREAATLPTPYLYELARRIAARDPDRAMQTYLLARTRMSYDATRCADAAALEALRAWDVLLAPDIRFLFAAGPPSTEVVNVAMEQEAKLPSETRPWWVCRSGMPAMIAAMSGEPGPLKLRPVSDWPALREEARAQVIAAASTRSNK